MSQASARQALTEELAAALRAEPWVGSVSPEVYALVGLGGRAVIVRGVQPEPFLAMEGLRPPAALGPEFLLVGERLAAALGVVPGDVLLLPGSTQPVLLEAPVEGILPARGAVADEILLDLPRARLLTGLRGTALTLLRVHVQDGDRLLAYLASTDREVLVAGGGASRLVEGGVVLDDRLGSLVLTDPELGRQLGRSYLGAFAQHGGNSLGILVLGMEALTLTLLLVILGSSLTRFWLEHRPQVGLLRALGGGAGAALRLFGRRLLVLGLPAIVAGLLAGVGTGKLLETLGAYAFLGHALPYPLDPFLLALLGLLYVAAFGGVVLLGLAFLLRQPPRDLLYEVPEPSHAAWEGLDRWWAAPEEGRPATGRRRSQR